MVDGGVEGVELRIQPPGLPVTESTSEICTAFNQCKDMYLWIWAQLI